MQLKCDFCFYSTPEYAVYCAPFVEVHSKIPGITCVSDDDGKWAVCAACKYYIDLGDRKGLLERCIHVWNAHEDEQLTPGSKEITWVIEIQNRFFDHLTGVVEKL